jgi:hypothetical protein
MVHYLHFRILEFSLTRPRFVAHLPRCGLMILGEILYLDGLGDGTTGLQADPPSTASHDPRLFTNGSLDSSGFHDFKVEDWILTTYMFLYIFFSSATSRRTKTSSTWTVGSCSPAKVPWWCQGNCGGFGCGVSETQRNNDNLIEVWLEPHEHA